MLKAIQSELQGIEEAPTDCYRIYSGTAEQLVNAGLVRHEQLPGQAGVGKTCATYSAGVLVRAGAQCRRDESYLTIRRCGASRFRIWIGRSDEERAAIEAAAEADRLRCEHEDHQRRARNEAARELASIPRSPDDYRKQQQRCVGAMLGVALSSLGPSEFSGYSYSESVIREFKTVSARLLAILEHGELGFDAGRQQARIDSLSVDVPAAQPKRPDLRLVRASARKIS